MGAINSQVNEQANAGLQRIKAHISYMKEDNFMFHVKLFLALTNCSLLSHYCSYCTCMYVFIHTRHNLHI